MTQDIEKRAMEIAKAIDEMSIDDACKVITTTLTKVYEEGVQVGRNQILEEWNHSQRKLLDGFNHPKDCAFCAKEQSDK